jgi:hypothetical protein
VQQTNHFFDLGYGWLCKHCSAQDAERKRQHSQTPAGFLNENKPQQKQSNAPACGLPLARWTNSTRQALSCPRCGIEEMISKA